MNYRKFDNFDDVANNYRAVHTENIKQISGVDSNYFSEYKIKEILQCEENIHDSIILDFGCGDGNSAQYFLKHLSPNSYYGIDVSSNSIEVAEQYKLERCQFQTFDGERIPFNDGTFDIIFMANVLHHIDSSYHKCIISECYRVLKSGGRLYVFEHNHLNPLTRKIVRDCQFDVDARLVPSTIMKKNLKELGFKNLEIRYTIFFPRKFISNFLVPFERYLQWCPLGGQYYSKCNK